ncbi:MAG: hypothetical protein ISR99_01525 [Parcubacteria group bacterium]|nr:hypothetical protein [Parcubacteria group bacterium]
MNDKFSFLLRRFELPIEKALKNIIKDLSPFEKVIFGALIGFLVITTLMLLNSVNRFLVSDVPAYGGTLTEGVVGFPRFINPILATTDADRDLTALLYSGLLRATPDRGFVHDLAESYTIADDGLTYSFVIKEDAVFHDGVSVTTDDIVFTILRAKDPVLKSPKRANWDGVGVEKISDHEVVFTLLRPYAPFLENVTIGILPSHIWKEVEPEQFPFSDRNTEPIGSGPYKIKKIERNGSGVPEHYKLEAFDKYTLGKPYINTLTFNFYTGEDELLLSYKKGQIDALNSVASKSLKEINPKRVEQVPLPRIFAIFFNQNQAPIFSNYEVRRALDVVIDKEGIVDEVLGGYATIINGPIPPELLPRSSDHTSEEYNEKERVAEAKDILESGGWKFDEENLLWTHKSKGDLSFSLSTSNVNELKDISKLIVTSWEKLGVKVDLQIFDVSDLNQNVIRPRKYSSLLFGEIVGRELDLFAFWHSSQRNDPGLNIALYANITADALLEKGRTATDKRTQIDSYKDFEKEVKTDSPAIFLYSPDFIYVIPKQIKGLSLGSVTTPAERFLNVHEWYIETDRVWNFFSN